MLAKISKAGGGTSVPANDGSGWSGANLGWKVFFVAGDGYTDRWPVVQYFRRQAPEGFTIDELDVDEDPPLEWLEACAAALASYAAVHGSRHRPIWVPHDLEERLARVQAE